MLKQDLSLDRVGIRVHEKEYCKYCETEFLLEDGLPSCCTGECGEDPMEWVDTDIVEELNFNDEYNPHTIYDEYDDE